MNMFGYEPKDREQFYSYLRESGLNENGANEVIERLENDRPHQDDINMFRRWKGSR